MSKKELYVKFYEVVLSLLSTFNIAKSFDNNIYISKLDLLSDSKNLYYCLRDDLIY